MATDYQPSFRPVADGPLARRPAATDHGRGLWLDEDGNLWRSDGTTWTLALSGTYAPAQSHKLTDAGDEAQAWVVWTGDDGYDTQSLYYATLAANGVHGTLFLSPDFVDAPGTSPTYGDHFITTAQVQALIAAGHEIGTHGKNHEDLLGYLNANGAAALDALLRASIAEIQTKFGVTPKTAAYPFGQSDQRTREIIGRTHQYVRMTKGVVARNAEDPYDVPGIDFNNPGSQLTEAQMKAFVDTAVANKSMVVFLCHGSVDASVQTKVANVIAYATAQGAKQSGFYDAMRQRYVQSGTGFGRDSRGYTNMFGLRARDIDVYRSDTLGDYWHLGYDETAGAGYFDQAPGNPYFEWRARFRFRSDQVAVGDVVSFLASAISNASPTFTLPAAAALTSADEGITIAGDATVVPAGAVLHVVDATHGQFYVAGVATNALATPTGGTSVLTLGRTVTTLTLNGPLHANGIDNLIQPTQWNSDTETIWHIKRSANAPANPNTDNAIMNHKGVLSLKGPNAQLAVFNGATQRCGFTTAGTVNIWDTGSGSMKTISCVNNVLSVA